ncbi:biopolymer transporter ExbB [Planktotalea arctica]|uniref:biopolymer transporter ExbB n=1 Tax=Planktotalea arctica TaxID=1481893 RepID=UPI000A16DA81|nr:biopolymer transporter ExbB [Planktotalea arctica]
MDKPDREIRAQFSQPWRQITLMLIVSGFVGAGVFIALPRVLPIFIANPWLNGFILGVFAIGVMACFWQVFQLIKMVRWIEEFASEKQSVDALSVPPLLAPLATLLRSRGARMQISSSSTRSILDSVATRIDEAREITRYIVNLLIFLGLLGTFYGLATTVPAIVDTIRNLSAAEGETGADVFKRLQSGLEAQMGGMGVAFGSSLLGLAGSLVVGLLELFAGHGQNRFYRELEEWLSSITRLGYSSGDGEGGVENSAMAAVVDHMAEQMEALQLMFTQSDVSRSMVDEKLGTLTDAISSMTERMEATGTATDALLRVAEGQERLIAKLDGGSLGGDGMDAESRMRLRSIDVQMLKILEEMSAGRAETMAELRSDIGALGRILTQPRKAPAGAAKSQASRTRDGG